MHGYLSGGVLTAFKLMTKMLHRSPCSKACLCVYMRFVCVCVRMCVSANCSNFPLTGSFSLSLIISLHHVGGTPYLHPSLSHCLLCSCFKCTHYLSPLPSLTFLLFTHTPGSLSVCVCVYVSLICLSLFSGVFDKVLMA